MTYCCALHVDDGLVFASDTRTNAGPDHIAVVPKMSVWERPGDRVIVLLVSGNLAITQKVVNLLNELTGGDAIIVTDVGQHQMVACRYARFNQTRSNITSGGLGTMGFGLPAAIGAKFGEPGRTVVGIIGDGGIQMTIQELGVIQQYGVGVKIVILNNQFLGMVRQWQELFHDRRYSFTDMVSPDFVKVADAYGIAGQRVSERFFLKNALQTMLETPGAYLLEVMVGKENNVFPMVPQGCGVAEIRLK